jgi:mannose-6-phosphate isomerase-like protein (cupin superfamily)
VSAPRRPHRVVHLDEVVALPGPGTLRAFGTNAYTAGAVGDDVVEPHTENPQLGHEELYFVARGTATFTIDDDTFDAREGTYVFVPDTASHRHAVAAEPGTTVLSFGGPATFTPSAWEWSFRASALRAEPERARAVLDEGFEAWPDSPGLHYELACLEASQGRTDEALAALRVAVEREPEVAEHARSDDDMDPLRDLPQFAEIVGR